MTGVLSSETGRYYCFRSEKVELMLVKCWMNGVLKRFQRHSTNESFNNVE